MVGSEPDSAPPGRAGVESGSAPGLTGEPAVAGRGRGREGIPRAMPEGKKLSVCVRERDGAAGCPSLSKSRPPAKRPGPLQVGSRAKPASGRRPAQVRVRWHGTVGGVPKDHMISPVTAAAQLGEDYYDDAGPPARQGPRAGPVFGLDAPARQWSSSSRYHDRPGSLPVGLGTRTRNAADRKPWHNAGLRLGVWAFHTGTLSHRILQRTACPSQSPHVNLDSDVTAWAPKADKDPPARLGT